MEEGQNIDSQNLIRTESHSESLSELGALASEAVEYYRKEGKLTPEQVSALQEVKLKSLAPMRRERVEEARSEMLRLSSEFDETIGDTRLQETELRANAGNLEKFNEAACAEFHNQAERLGRNNNKLEQIFRNTREKALKEIWHDAEGAETAEIDPFTGLHTKEALMQRLSKNILEARKNGDGRKLINIEVRAGDMNNFKQGNDILGHQGFDDLLQKEFAARFIAVSRYLGSTEYAEDVDTEVFDSFFPPGSTERTRLDEAKGKLRVDLYRMKAGADEIFTATEYLDQNVDADERDRLRNLSEAIIDDTYRSIVIGKHGKEQLLNMREIFDNSPNYFKLVHSQTPEGSVIMDAHEADTWNKFADSLRLYIRSRNFGEKMVADPDCVLRLSADMSRPHPLAEGLNMLLTGKDFSGAEVDADRSVRLIDDEGKKNEGAVRKLTEKVYSAVTRRVTSVGITSEKEMEEIIELGTANMAVGLLLQESMKEADENSKPDGKRRLLVDAWTGRGKNPEEAVYGVASLLSSGRLTQEMADPAKAREVYTETRRFYVQKMADEIGKLRIALEEAGWSQDSQTAAPLGDLFTGEKVDYKILAFYAKFADAIEQQRYLYSITRFQNENIEEADLKFPDYLSLLPELPEGIKLYELQDALRMR